MRSPCTTGTSPALAALDRAVEAETTPVPVVDRLDLLVLRRSGRAG
jgi:hypothetical protein